MMVFYPWTYFKAFPGQQYVISAHPTPPQALWSSACLLYSGMGLLAGNNELDHACPGFTDLELIKVLPNFLFSKSKR